MNSAPQHSTSNRILASLPAEEYRRLPHMESVELRLSEVLYRPEEQTPYGYFPTDAIISLLTELEDGGGVEVGLVGREGMAGISVILGGEETKVATAQMKGEAVRLRPGALREEFQRGGALHDLLLRYTSALMTQISQSVACNARHPLPGRMARWLLMFHDRAGSDEFELTQEFMANMLGVRRAGVTTLAGRLKRDGFIGYERGHFKVLDRKGLEGFACECYQVVKQGV